MADDQIIAAMTGLWRIPRPGPDNLMSTSEFEALSGRCHALYGCGKVAFALSNALRSLGLPCTLPPAPANLALDPRSAAEMLETAFVRNTTVRRHICPLDLADDLPPLAFGRARVGQFSSGELSVLFDVARLARNFPRLPLEAERLAQFHWLVVEEEVDIDPRPEARAVPILFTDLSRDFGEIEPHLGRFPAAVEDALFFLLLAPWEVWSGMPEVDWRGFRIPWIYTLDEDLFIRPTRPPNVESLSLEPWIVTDSWGEEIELERPSQLSLCEDAQAELGRFTEAAWRELQAARQTALFETPIVHFMVRAFLADGLDEIMAHMTAIEAAVGLEMDHRRKLRPKPDPHKSVSPSDRVAARIAALLNDAGAVQDYRCLFELRSAFVHGRGGLQPISTAQRVLARSLARRVVGALVYAAQQPTRPRIEVLSDLLDRGVKFL